MSLTDKEIREKLASRGCDTLSDAELISIVIREGDTSRSAFEISEELLQRNGGSLEQLAKADFNTLRSQCSLAAKRAGPLSAAMELSKRLRRETSPSPSVITSNEDVEAIFQPLLSDLPYEEFWVVYLTSSNRILEHVKVSQGGVSATIVDYKLLIKRALELLASSMILVHNHPSGECAPSGDDILQTNRILEAATLFDIRLLDHLILSGNKSYSFRYNGLI